MNIEDIRIQVQELIRENQVPNLEKYVKKNKLELKMCNDDQFDIMKFSHSLWKKNQISHEMYKAVVHHLDYTRSSVIKIMKNNDLESLKRNTQENNLEFKNFNYSHLNIFNYTLYQFKKGSLSEEMKDFIIFNFDKNRRQVMQLIQGDNIPELNNFMKKNHLEFSGLNDEYFDILKYCFSHHFSISVRMRYYVINHYNEKRGTIIEYIRSNNFHGLNNYLKDNDIELKSIEDDYFNLMVYCHREQNHISSFMKDYIIQNYNTPRKTIVSYIRREYYMGIKTYSEEHEEFSFKNLDDNYFSIIDFCNSYINQINKKDSKANNIGSNHITSSIPSSSSSSTTNNTNHQYLYKIKNYIIQNYTQSRKEVIKFIQNNDIEDLKDFIDQNNIILKDLSDDHFNLIDYCQNNRYVSSEMRRFIISHYDILKCDIIFLIEIRNEKELRDYITSKNLEFESLNTDQFNIIEYCNTCDPPLDSTIKNIILKNYNHTIHTIIDIIESDDLEELQNYIEINDIELNQLDTNKYFNILEYLQISPKNVNDSNNNNNDNDNGNHISLRMKNFIVSHLYRLRSNIVELIRLNDVSELKKINCEFSLLNDDYFDILSYCQDPVNQISSEMKRFIQTQWDKHSFIGDIIKKNRLEDLIQYMESNQKLEFNHFVNESFNIIEYSLTLFNKEKISFDIIHYIFRHFDSFTQIIFSFMEKNDLASLKKFFMENSDSLKSFNDIYYDIFSATQSIMNGISSDKIKFILHYFDKTRNEILQCLQKNSIEDLKKFLKRKHLEIKDLNAYFYDIQDDGEPIINEYSLIDFCEKESNHISIMTRRYIISHYYRKRGETYEVIRRNRILDLNNYLQKNQLELKQLEDDRFKIIEFCESDKYITTNMREFVRTHYDRQRSEVVEWIRSKQMKKFVEYLEETDIELKTLNDEHFNILQYCEEELKNKNILEPFKNIIIKYYDRGRRDLIKNIEKKDMNVFRSYYDTKLYTNKIELNSFNDDHFNLIEYCSNQRNTTLNIKNYIINHYTRERGELVECIRKNNYSELKELIETSPNLNLNGMDDEYFHLKRYVFSLYDKKIISEKVKYYINIQSNPLRKEVISIINKFDIDLLRSYMEEHPYFEFKQLDDDYFYILDYIKYKKNQLFLMESRFIVEYIYSHFDHAINQIVDVIKRNDLVILKEYLRENKINEEKINANYIPVINYQCKNFILSNELEEFIKTFFDTRKIDILAILKRKNLDELKQYKEKYLEEFQELNGCNNSDGQDSDLNFDILKYCYDEEHHIPDSIKNYIVQNYTKKRSHVIQLINKRNIRNLKNYMESSDTFFKEVEDKYFSIIEFCKNQNNHISQKMKDYIIINYTKERSDVVKKIKQKDFNRMKDLFEYKSIETKTLNDENFNLLNYLKKEVNNPTLYSSIKYLLMKYYDREHTKIIKLLEDGLKEEAMNELKDENLDFRDLNEGNDFNILDYCRSSQTIDPSVMKYVQSHYYRQRGIVVDYIENSEINKLKIFLIENNNLELEKLSDNHFNIKNYTYYLYCNKLITSDMKDFITIYSDEKKREAFNIIEKNNLTDLVNFTRKKKNMRFKDLNDYQFNFIKYCHNLCEKNIISLTIKKYLFLHYDDIIGKLVEIILQNDLEKVQNYCNTHKTHYHLFNKKYFDLLKSLFSQKLDSSSQIESLILNFFNEKKCYILEYILNNDLEKLKKYLKEKNIKELVELNDLYFNITEFIHSKAVTLTQKMKIYIISHLNRLRFEIVNWIDDNNIDQLNNYYLTTRFEFKSLNDEEFDIMKYCQMMNISPNMKKFVIIHYNNKRYRLVKLLEDIINGHKSLNCLKSHMKEENIEFKSMNDSYFNVLKYCNSVSLEKSYDVKNFIINHYTYQRSLLVDLIESSNLLQLKSTLIVNNIALEDVNDDQFNIRRYTYSLYDEGLILDEMKDFVTISTDKSKKEVIDIIERDNLHDLQNYVRNHQIEFKELNDGRLNIIKYINDINLKGIISYEVKLFIFSHFDKLIGIIIDYIQKGKFDEMKHYIDENKINYKILNKNYLDIIESLSTEMGIKYPEFNQFISTFFDPQKYTIIEMIRKNDIQGIKNYKKVNQITDFIRLNDQYFNIMEYCNSSPEISPQIKIYIQSHLYQHRDKIVNMIEKNDISELRQYTQTNHYEFKKLNEGDDFDIMAYCQFQHVAQEIQDHILIHYDNDRYKAVHHIQEILKTKSISGEDQSTQWTQRFNDFKSFVNDYNIQFQNINDNYFDIITYLKIDNKTDLVDFINTHYNEQRSNVLRYIKSGNLNELRNYTRDNLIQLEKLNSKTFDILSYSISKLNPSAEMVNFIIQQGNHYDFSIYQSNLKQFPLYIALSKSSFKVADALLYNKMDINSHKDNLMYELRNNKKAIHYLLQHGYKKEYINIKELIMSYNEYEVIKIIFDESIFNNEFILTMLLSGKHHMPISQSNLQNIIDKEINKFGNINTLKDLAECYYKNSCSQYLKTFSTNKSSNNIISINSITETSRFRTLRFPREIREFPRRNRLNSIFFDI